MASVEELIVAKLRGTSAISDIVGTRVYFKRARQGAALPNIVYQLVSTAERPQGMSRDVPIDRKRYQIKARAASPTEARNLAEAIAVAFEQWRTDGPPRVEHTVFAGGVDLEETGRAKGGAEKAIDVRALDFIFSVRRD